jgi:hypothetical protein
MKTLHPAKLRLAARREPGRHEAACALARVGVTVAHPLSCEPSGEHSGGADGGLA